MTRVLGVFAKYWRPGKVKTRLAETEGPEQAAQIYRAMLSAVLARFQGLAERQVLAYTPADRRDEFTGLAAAQGWALEPQQPGNLGERMSSFFEAAFAAGARRVVLLGSDSPTAPREAVEQAFDLLRQNPVALAPTPDGGYWLVGAARAAPPIFDGVAWSSRDVWRQTVARLESLGVSYAQLPAWYDVDDAGDLARLRGELADIPATEPSLVELRAAIDRAGINPAARGADPK